MEEQVIKKNFSKNLVELRKSKGLTQVQLAEKLNYSDKSVSKWECGDVLPDVITITEIAEFFDLSVDRLLSEDLPTQNIKRKVRSLIVFLSFVGTWFIASVVFFFLWAYGVKNSWYSYMIAIPTSFAVLMILSCVWFGDAEKFLSVSGFIWAVAVTVFVMLREYNLWYIFIVTTVLEVLVFYWFKLIKYGRIYKQTKNKVNNND